MPEALSFENVFSTNQAALSQCDRSELFLLSFGGQDISFRLCELLAFRKKLMKIDLNDLFSSDMPDIEVLYLAHCDRFVILSIKDILELRELFAGAITMLELNSLLHKYLYRNPF